MGHKKNIDAFLQAAQGGADDLVRAYCALVAIELCLKQYVGLSDHDIPAGIDRVRLKLATGLKAGCRPQLTALANRLRNAISAIAVQNKSGTAQFAPGRSYPYIRYTRFADDHWGPPETMGEQLTYLLTTANEIRYYLRSKFSMPL